VPTTPSPTSNQRAALYVRISRDDLDTRAGIKRQEADCRQLAEQRGLDVISLYSDNDQSASSGKRRPDYQRLLADVRAKRVDVIVCYHLDRLVRRMVDLEEVIALGVPVLTVTGDLDLSNDTGRLLARVLGSVAQGEVERKGARQRRANAEAAHNGAPAGGRRPFGYDITRVVIDEEEAQAIREAYAVLLAGGTLYGLAADFNRRGLTTTAGNPWRVSTVRRMLQNPRYAGLREYHGEIMPTPGRWPAIVDESTWRAACQLLADASRASVEPGRPRKYLLSGMTRCGICGLHMASGASARGRFQYKCVGNKHLTLAMAGVDEYVVGAVVRRLARSDAYDLMLDEVKRPDLVAVRAEALALRERLDGLAALVADGTLTPGQVRASSEGLRERLARAEALITDAGKVDALGPLIAAAGMADDQAERRERVHEEWLKLDLGRQRAVIKALMTIRMFSPGRGARYFKPESVEITWRDGSADSA